jgi:hypothetical protein
MSVTASIRAFRIPNYTISNLYDMIKPHAGGSRVIPGSGIIVHSIGEQDTPFSGPE